MKKSLLAAAAGLFILWSTSLLAQPAVYPQQEGFVDSGGILIYYKSIGQGAPLLVVHGGPGASHDYLLPHLLPLARTHRLIFIDERGSGRSQKLENAKGYTVETMVEDVEAVRQALELGKIALLGHSYGGVARAGLRAEVPAEPLASDPRRARSHSTKALNEVFQRMKAKMAPELRARIDNAGEGRPLRPRQGFREGPLHRTTT